MLLDRRKFIPYAFSAFFACKTENYYRTEKHQQNDMKIQKFQFYIGSNWMRNA